MMQQFLASLKNNNSQPALVILYTSYFLLNIALSLLTAYSFALGLTCTIIINLFVLFLWKYAWILPFYVLIAGPSLVRPISSVGLLSRFFIGNAVMILLVIIGLLRMSFLPFASRLSSALIKLLAPLIAITIIGSISIISSRMNPDPGVSYSFTHSDVTLTIVNATEILLLLGFPIFLLVMTYLIQKQEHIRLLVNTFIVLGILYALGTIFAKPLGLYSQQTILGIQRPEIFGISSSILGMLLVFLVCVTLGHALYAKKNAGLYWWLTAIFTVAVVLSFGRTAWISLCFSYLIMIGLYTKSLAVIPIILVLILLFFIPDVSNFFDPQKVYGVDRLIMWQDAIAIWLRHPYFGVGAGNYQFFDLAYGTDIGGVAHNQFLEVLAEMGVQGLLCLLWSIFAIGRVALFSFHTAKTVLGKAISLAYLGYYTGLIVFGFFGDSFLPSVAGAGGTAALILASYNWILLGMVVTLPQWEQVAAKNVVGVGQ